MQLKHLLGMGRGALSANLFKNRIPLNVMFAPTNRCQSQCCYCNIPGREKTELSTKEVFLLIDEVSKLGCQRIGLWGGEPLLREDIGDIVDYAKRKLLFVTLDTNGYLLPKKIKLLKRLDHLNIAFDGGEKAHDLNRGKGSFQKAMAAIEAACGKIPLWTITVLTKHNLEDIDFILNTAKEYGFFSTFQLLHHNDVLGRNHDFLRPEPNEYRIAIQKLIEEKKKGKPIVSSTNYLQHILKWPDYNSITSYVSLNKIKCWAGQLYCNVDSDGKVYPCSLQIGKVKAVSFLQGGFKKAFAGLDCDSCNSCLGACFTDYNLLYSWDMKTICEWLKAMRETKKYLWKVKNYR